jgi:glycosyltransferase involved in cell wall biosynthesis
MKLERVTAVIPTYNYGRYVAQAVESALAQTHPVEVVVVDDGSTDDTAERLAPFAGMITQLRQENRGLSAARNAGIRSASGDWIALLDADDLWHEEKIEAQLAAARVEPAVVLLGSPACRRPPSGALGRTTARRLGVQDFLATSPFGPSSALIRREALDVIGLFDERLTSAEDRDLWLRLAARFPAAEVALPCWYYRSHPDQMSRNASRMYENYRTVLTRFFAEHPEHVRLGRRAFAYLDVDTALCYLDQGDRATARRFLMRSLARWPRPLGDPRLRTRFWRAKLLTRASIGEDWALRLGRIVHGTSRATRSSLPEVTGS